MRDGALSAAQIFGALIWQIGLPDRSTARPSLPPPLILAVSGTLSAVTAYLWTPA